MSDFVSARPEWPGLPLTVVIPCASRLRYAQNAVDAWLRTPLPFACDTAFSVLLVDYGCRQNSFEWVMNRQDPRIEALKVLTNDSPFSLSRARNIGGLAARPGVVVFSDADILNKHPTALDAAVLTVMAGEKRSVVRFDWRTPGFDRPAGSWPLVMHRDTFVMSGGLEERFVDYGFEDAEYLQHLRNTFDFVDLPVGQQVEHMPLTGLAHDPDLREQRRLSHDKNFWRWQQWQERGDLVRNPNGWGVADFAYCYGQRQLTLGHTGFTRDASVSVS